MTSAELEAFFSGQAESLRLFEALRTAIASIGSYELRVSKSQVAFRRKKNFAMAWMPEQYLRRKAAPLVLTLSFRRRDDSPRWKEIVEPSPGRFTHHLELYSPDEIDDEVRAWLKQAWDEAE
jgi:predicted transport protein